MDGDGEAVRREGQRVLRHEAAALARLAETLDDRFARAVDLIAGCRGKVVTAAIGKSGLIARKIASTLSSLGVPAVFLHPTEALHGDLGLITPDDIVIAISHSANTREVVYFLEVLRQRFDLPILAVVGRAGGAIDGLVTLTLETGVVEEACALRLTPTTSSTAALALGDALAVCASQARGFRVDQFARLHPAGTLGRRFYLPIREILRPDYPRVVAETPLDQVAEAITRGGLGLVLVVDPDGRVAGIVTDGDVRRAIHPGRAPEAIPAGEIMSVSPVSIGIDAVGSDALALMESRKITALVVRADDGRAVGLIHLHDLLEFGLGEASLGRRAD